MIGHSKVKMINFKKTVGTIVKLVSCWVRKQKLNKEVMNVKYSCGVNHNIIYLINLKVCYNHDNILT